MKKRLLFIPLHYNTTPQPHEDWFNALNDEFDVMYFRFDLANRTLTGAFKPEYIFIQSGAILPDQVEYIKEYTGAKLIQWTGDARSEAMENVTQYKGVVDLTLLAVGIGQKEMYEKALGSPVGYMQQGVFESFFKEPKELESGRIVFIGNNYDHFEGAVERSELCKMLSSKFRIDEFEVIGNGFNNSSWNNVRSIPYDESAQIYNDAYISISHACFNDIEGYYSNRTLDIMASGGCCFMRYVPNLEQFFENGKHCVFYYDNEDCKTKIEYFLKRPDLRNEIARNGYELAKQKHTFKQRAKEIKFYTDTI